MNAVDQKPAARHVDRIGELMEADDDGDDEMTSDSCRQSLDKHDQHDHHVVGGPPGDDAVLPAADAGASCVQRPDGCHGDDDESEQQRRVEESLPSEQQAATGGYRRLSASSQSVCLYMFLYICLRVCVCTCVNASAAASSTRAVHDNELTLFTLLIRVVLTGIDVCRS